jgi:hypothetical protein
MSSGRPTRRTGIVATSRSTFASLTLASAMIVPMTEPGGIVFTVMPSGPSS